MTAAGLMPAGHDGCGEVNRDHSAGRWLVLLYQFPSGPDSRRVRIWRRLQGIGAVSIKNSVYVLPFNDQSREDFEWLLGELRSSGADGAILESRFVDGMSDAQIQALFNDARAADYRALQDEIQAALDALPDGTTVDDERLEDARRTLTRVRKRLGEIEAMDFFGADGLELVESGVRALTERTTQGEEADVTAKHLQDLKNRVWVTRRGVRVDRIASAWLIRRHIDPAATIRCVASDYEPRERELRFDMYEAEFTHEGELCTFEVLARLVDADDAALRAIGEIVHDIDLKDGKFGRPETQGVATLLDGIVSGTDDDEARIERGSALFDDLYRSWHGRQQ